MLQATVNQRTLSIESRPEGTFVDGEHLPADWTEIRPGVFHVLHGTRSLTVEVRAADYVTKTFTLRVNGTEYAVQLKDRFDQLLDQLGLAGAAAARLEALKAPMPGLIVSVAVEPGQAVKKGDTLLILEAMKMENVLKAATDAVVKAVRVEARQNVEKGQVLIEF
jgi:biotin carboxyl carrier protein